MSSHRSIATVIAVLFLAAPLAAQGVSLDLSAPAATSVSFAPVAASAPAPEVAQSAGPSMQNLAVGVRSNVGQPAPAEPYRAATGRSTAMMVVGGAALIVGAVVGGQAGTIVMIGGGIIGLVGLWNYLQ